MSQEPVKNSLFRRFELRIEGETALLEYQERDAEVLIFTHTFVPEALRGKNVAALLTRFALDDARRLGKKVEPRCTYVDAFMNRYPEYADLRA